MRLYSYCLVCLFAISCGNETDGNRESLSQPKAETDVAPEVLECAAATPPPRDQLENGGYYQVTRPLNIASEIVTASGASLTNRSETIPSGGIFQVVRSVEKGDELFYEILVSNGAQTYTMYADGDGVGRQSVRKYEAPAVANPPSQSVPQTAFQPAQRGNAAAGSYYVGDTGTKYHTFGCRTLKGSKHPITMQQIRSQGREACKVCNPR